MSICSFPKWENSSCTLSSIFLSFEVFDVFRSTGRSFSLDFCFLIFLILVCALTWVQNYRISGESTFEVHCRFWSHSKCSFLKPTNCYLNPNAKLPLWAIYSQGCESSLDCTPQWAIQIVYLPQRRHLLISGFFCWHLITSQTPGHCRGPYQKGKSLLSPVITPLLQSTLAIGISSLLNYHTCHPDAGRMIGTTHIMRQNHSVSKWPLWASEIQRIRSGNISSGNHPEMSKVGPASLFPG